MSGPREAIELNISPEKVFFIAARAKEFDAKADAGAGEDAETVAEGGPPLAAEFAGDPGAEELSGAIDQLSDDEVIDLIGLTWVGRGDFDRTSWAEARALAADRHRRHSSRYLMGVPLLGEYLEGGLDECIPTAPNDCLYVYFPIFDEELPDLTKLEAVLGSPPANVLDHGLLVP